jgi:hypothetical protein
MDFLVSLGAGCVTFLQQQDLDKTRINVAIDIIEYCIEALCHLSDPTNPSHQLALQYVSCLQFKRKV